MFKSRTTEKLPTLLQWFKENQNKDEDFLHQITKIGWTEEFRSITFYTEEFRYTIKGSSVKDWDDLCRKILDAINVKEPNFVCLEYSGLSGEVEVFINDYRDNEVLQPKKFIQFDWGLIFEEWVEPKKPASKAKPGIAKATANGTRTDN